MKFKKCLLPIVLGFYSITCIPPLSAKDLVVRSPCGDSFVVEIEPQESFEIVVARVEQCLNALERDQKEFLVGDLAYKDHPREFLLDFMPSQLISSDQGKDSEKSSENKARDYYAVPTQDEIDDVAYIVTTLAETPYARLLGKRKELKKRGKHVEHLHPLKFLTIIFSNEHLRAALHVLRGRDGFFKGISVWDEFKDELFASLTKETKHKNMKEEYILDFARALEIDSAAILGVAQAQSWGKFIDTLLKLKPRHKKARPV
jgi:hypothetical protein